MFSNFFQLNSNLKKNKKYLNKFSFKLYHWLLKMPNSLIYCKKRKINFIYLSFRIKKRVDFFLFYNLSMFSSLKETKFWLQSKDFLSLNQTKIRSCSLYLKTNDCLVFNSILIPELIKNWTINESLTFLDIMKSGEKFFYNANFSKKYIFWRDAFFSPEFRFKIKKKHSLLMKHIKKNSQKFIFDSYTWAVIYLD